MYFNNKAFTIIELLIVIAIIAILASVVFVALDPLTRFRDARDSTRWNDVTEILSAIKVDQIDNGGAFLSAIVAMTTGTYMIGTNTVGCDDINASCDTNMTGDPFCVDLAGLVTEGYLGAVPISPDGAVTTWSVGETGYTLRVEEINDPDAGLVTVSSCESENAASISVYR